MKTVSLLAALLLAGCSDAPAMGGTAATSEALADPNALVLTSDGIARLGAETPFDTVAVRAALPAGFTTELHDGQTGDPAIWALRDGQIVFEVYGSDTVTHIDAPNAAVSGPNGARPGQTFAEADGTSMDCALGADRFANLALCRTDGLTYVFASQALLGQTGMPGTEALGDAFLERIVWSAGG